MRVMFKLADPKNEEDKQELFELDRAIFSRDRFDTWDDYQTFFIRPTESMAGMPKSVGSIACVPNLTIGKSWDEDAESPGTLWLVSIGVRPEFQKRGIATHAMCWLRVRAQADGYAQVISNFRVSNTASRRLHEKCGFRLIEIVKDYYRNPVEDAQVVKMRF